ncbi:MAG: NUDIX hydrolase [Planctomycetota bacterium]
MSDPPARDPAPQIEVLSSEKIYSGRIFDLVRAAIRLPSGLKQDVTWVDHPGAVSIAALDEHGRMLLVRQYRHAVGDWLIEIPAGRIELGEDRLAAARRELEEETGHRAQRWRLLREFYAAPGFCSELMSIYEARELSIAGPSARACDHDEELELLRMTPREVLAAPICDAKTLVAAALLSS